MPFKIIINLTAQGKQSAVQFIEQSEKVYELCVFEH